MLWTKKGKKKLKKFITLFRYETIEREKTKTWKCQDLQIREEKGAFQELESVEI